MMCTVHYCGVPKQIGKTGAWQELRGVILVFPLVAVDVGGRQVLYNGAAESDIDDLHTLADAKYGHGLPDGVIKSLQLQNIKLGINVAGTGIVFSEKGRSDITAAGEKQTVAGGELIPA